MKSKLSALLDGEQTAEELDRICATLGTPEAREAWAEYVVIGAALRRDAQLNFDISGKVMAALADEPTVLAPKALDAPGSMLAPKVNAARVQWLSALAAGLAGVSLVAWVSFAVSTTEPEIQIAKAAAPVGTATLPTDSPPPPMQDYVIAHQAHASGGTLTGGSRNVRAVSASRGRP